MVIVIVVFDHFRMMLYKILNALGLELGKDLWKGKDIWSFSPLYTLTSVYTFSKLFSIYFVACW